MPDKDDEGGRCGKRGEGVGRGVIRIVGSERRLVGGFVYIVVVIVLECALYKRFSIRSNRAHTHTHLPCHAVPLFSRRFVWAGTCEFLFAGCCLWCEAIVAMQRYTITCRGVTGANLIPSGFI